jgi:Phosphoenolpyruvate hydrolase-like
MPRLDRQAILGKLQAMKKARQPVIGGGAGTGLSAKCEEAGGIDHLQFRSLPHGGAGLTCWRARPRQRERDRAGHGAGSAAGGQAQAGSRRRQRTDPFCLFDPFLDDLKRLGFSGVQNFPMVGLIDGICAPIQKRQACPTRSRSR